MRKRLSVFLAAVMLLSCLAGMQIVRADEPPLPFELVAPGNVSAQWMETNDSPTTTSIAYSLSNEMTEFFKKLEESSIAGTRDAFMAATGYDDIILTTQVDWAVDDVNDAVSGWHYNQYWDAIEGYGLGYDDQGRIRVGEWDGVDLGIGNATETVNDHWVSRGVSEDALNGNTEEGRPGLKDQLKSEQYSWHDDALWIDYTAHTVYFRMRFVLITSRETPDGLKETVRYSDWSNVASVGKDAEKYEPLKPGDIKAPEITDLHMTDKEFNGNPVVAFTLSVPEDLMEKATQVQAHRGMIVIETEARVKGDADWTGMGNTDWIIKAGEMECALLHLVNENRTTIPKDTPIELRCRYRISQEDQDDFYSDYSQVLSFGTEEINQGGETAPAGTTVLPSTEAAAPAEKDSCSLCHFCPQPLGICIFIWLLIILVIAVVVYLVLKKNKKKE